MKSVRGSIRPAPWRVGENVPQAPVAPAAGEGSGSKKGMIALAFLGAGAIAFGILEILGYTHVFSPAPAPSPAPALPPPAPK